MAVRDVSVQHAVQRRDVNAAQLGWRQEAILPMGRAMARKTKPTAFETSPLDTKGLDANVRKRILSYGAPDRRETDKKELDVPKRRRDDPSDSSSDQQD
jgi:hypothetical protein